MFHLSQFLRGACTAIEKSFSSDPVEDDGALGVTNNTKIHIKRILSAIKGHLSQEVLGAVFAAYLNDGGAKFVCSHDFVHVFLHQTVSLFKDEPMTGFMKTLNKNKANQEVIFNDVQLRDYLNRPKDLENLCQYEFYAKYERASSNRYIKFLNAHPLTHSHSLKRLVFDNVPTVSHRLGI